MIAQRAQDTPHDKVRVLQRKLYRAAKAAPQRTFGLLYDKVYRRDVLEEAWRRVRRNRGGAGVDKQTIADVEVYGVVLRKITCRSGLVREGLLGRGKTLIVKGRRFVISARSACISPVIFKQRPQPN